MKHIIADSEIQQRAASIAHDRGFIGEADRLGSVDVRELISTIRGQVKCEVADSLPREDVLRGLAMALYSDFLHYEISRRRA